MWLSDFALILHIFVNLVLSTSGSNDFCFRRQEKINYGGSDPALLEWMVDSETETVTFDLHLEALEETHKVGIGFFQSGKWTQGELTDFVLFEKSENGGGSVSDMSIRTEKDGDIVILKDSSPDYFLKSFSSAEKSMKISFWRKWDTKDDRDIKIDMSLIRIMLIDMDENSTLKFPILLREANILKAYLLDPEFSPEPIERLKTWVIKNKIAIPPKPTTYWCQIHKFPESLRMMHHMIGFKTKLVNDIAKRHTHHIVLYQCDKSISGQKYEALSAEEGEECYHSGRNGKLPLQHCRTFAYVWGYGGNGFFLPNDVGLPIDGEEVYFIMESHFDNPLSSQDLEVEIEIEVSYTKDVREHDAGLVMTGYDISPSLIIPPRSENMIVYGHCLPKCTSQFIPEEGITIFGVLPHSHMSGRKISLSHIAQTNNHDDDEDNNILIYDDFYDFQYQQARFLQDRRKLFPGNHLVTQCTYNTKWKNGTTFGGLSTQEEMCLNFLMYYPKIRNFDGCTSGIPLFKMMELFGIRETKLSAGDKSRKLIVTDPKKFDNRTLKDVVDNDITWDSELKEKIKNSYQDGNAQTDSYC